MDNLSNAIFLAFTMMALVIGLSFGLYLVGNMNSVASTLININDKTNDYQSISYDSSNINNKGKVTDSQKREVSADIVVSTLYKYFLEDFSVEIYYRGNNSNNPDQLFDLTVENVLATADETSSEYIAYNDLYSGKPGTFPDLFGAPWTVNKAYTKQRVDMFVGSKKGYINGTLVDYSGKKNGRDVGFSNHSGSSFLEEFIQYTFDGETISSDAEGEEIETIVGSRRAQSKIIIRYKEI